MHSIYRTGRLIIRKVLNFMVMAGLFVLYCLGFGLTFLASLIFCRTALKDKNMRGGTYWREAERYEDTIEEARRQS
jgi:hypothetical protein